MIHVPGPVHIADWGHGPTRFVLVHGLGGCHLNWMAVAPELSKHGRVVAPDLAGFGLTPTAGRQTTVSANQELLHRILITVSREPVILVGNSMGGLISMMEAARHPEAVAGLILVSPALPARLTARIDPVVLAALASWLAPRIAAESLQRIRGMQNHEERARAIMALCAANWRTIPLSIVDAHIQFSKLRGTSKENDRTVVSAARSIQSAYLHGGAIRHMLRDIGAPTLLIHGDRDRIVNVSASRQAATIRPDWDLKVLKGIGHIPQMEAPPRFIGVVDRWLSHQSLPRTEMVGRRPATARVWVATRPAGATLRPRPIAG